MQNSLYTVIGILIYELQTDVMDVLSTRKLQLIQNAAARVLTNTKKVDHITPVLKSLDWLPVCQIIDFKILLLV